MDRPARRVGQRQVPGFAEYAGKNLNRSAQKKPSLLGQLSHFKEIAKNLTRDTAKNRKKGGIEL